MDGTRGEKEGGLIEGRGVGGGWRGVEGDRGEGREDTAYL